MYINREAEQKLCHKTLTRVLDYNKSTGIFTWKISASNSIHPGTKAGSVHNKRCIVIRINGTDYYAHRLAWYYVYGKWPKEIIDHIDRDAFNNAIDNLRDTDWSVSNTNKKVQERNVSNVKGITKIEGSGKWRVQITVNKKTVHIGCFLYIEEAIKAKQEAEEKLCTVTE